MKLTEIICGVEKICLDDDKITIILTPQEIMNLKSLLEELSLQEESNWPKLGMCYTFINSFNEIISTWIDCRQSKQKGI